MAAKNNSMHYVDNKKFYDAIQDYLNAYSESKEKGLPEPPIPNYIGECIWKIANKLSTKPCFLNYSFRDEMISDGIENCFMYFRDFNPQKSNNPFAYFTQVIYYAFLRRIEKEKKIRYATYKYFQETMLHTSDADGLVDGDDNHVMPTKMYDNINDFMGKFEAREEEKKRKRKEMKGLQKFYEEQNEEGNNQFTPTGRITDPQLAK